MRGAPPRALYRPATSASFSAHHARATSGGALIPSWLEILGFVTGAACVWLLIRENVWNWPIGIANNLLFLVLFWRSGLFADSGLQLVFVALSLFGWWNWLRGGAAQAAPQVARTPPAAAAAVGGATLAAGLGLAWFLGRYTPSTVPWGDAATTALSLSAIYLQARKWIETWHLWIAADLLYIGLYLAKNLWLTALLYAIFLAMCVAGLREWRRRLPGAPAGAAIGGRSEAASGA